MAESTEEQLSLIEESETSENEILESQPSQSLLPQGPVQLECNEPNESDTSSTFIEDSQNEFSGFSENYSSEITDPFDRIFYHMMPSKDSTGIFFYTKPLFNSIISALDKEFKIPENSFEQFSLKTHVDGKRCCIKVDKADMTITLSGPGHVCWREKNFKKLTINMFNNFVDETKTVLYTSCNATASDVSVHDSKNDSTISLDQANIAHPKSLVQLDQESPLMLNISAIMDMIHSLQEQVKTLTMQVNKLVLEEANSMYRTIDETAISQRQEDVTFNNNKTSENLSMPGTGAEPTTRDHAFNAEKASIVNRNLVVNKTRLTSTPIPSTSYTNDKIPPTPKSRRQPKSSTYPATSTGPVPSSRPVPKPRQSVQRTNGSKQIFLIGDSIVSGINPKGLKENVRRDGIPGASVDCILKEVSVFDLSQFSHIVIYVGGNNASKGTDTEYFEEKYDQLLDYIKKKNNKCEVLVVSSCPRGDTDTTEVNSIIHRLADEHQMTFVDAYYAFHNKHGEVIERYYSKDSIHLSTSGIKRLLGTINNFVNIVQNFDQCGYLRRQGRGRPATAQLKRGLNAGNQRLPAHNGGKLLCNKCGETNHSTIQCRHSDCIQCHHCGYSGHKSKRCVNK